MPATLAQSPLWSTSTIGSANAHLVEREGGALHHRLCNMASNEVRSIIFTARSPVTRSAEVEISDRNVGPKLTSVHVHHRRRPSQQNKDHRPGPKLTRLCRRPSRKALSLWSTSTIGSAMLTCGEGGEGFCTIGSELKAWFRTKSGAGTAYGRC